MQTIGADQNIAVDFRAIGKQRADAAGMVRDVLKLHARPIAVVRQLPPQRAIEQRPGAEDFLERQPRDHLAVAIETNARGPEPRSIHPPRCRAGA